MESQGLRYNIQFESKLVDNPLHLHPKMCTQNLSIKFYVICFKSGKPCKGLVLVHESHCICKPYLPGLYEGREWLQIQCES